MVSSTGGGVAEEMWKGVYGMKYLTMRNEFQFEANFTNFQRREWMKGEIELACVSKRGRAIIRRHS